MKKICLASLLALAATAASAQVYVGATVGQSRVNLDCEDYNLGCDKSDTGKKVYVGYQLNPTVALEAAYVDFGKGSRAYTGSYFNGVVLANADVTETIEASGVVLAGAFRAAVHPQVSLVGRLGLAMLKTRFNESAPAIPYKNSLSDDSVKPYVGLGAEFSVTKALRLTAEADFTTAEVDGDSGAVRMLGVGLQYAF